MIRESRVQKNVMVGSFSPQVLREFRQECPEVATSASTDEVSAFLVMLSGGPDATQSLAAQALQVPEYVGGRPLPTRELIEAAHRRGLQVHAWTINDEESMKHLIELGVDGIMTDYPDLLIKLLQSKE